MSWLTSVAIAFLTSIFSAVVGWFVAAGCVQWYRIPAREGESGYFMVAIALLSGFGGFVLGLVLSRFSGGGFLKGLGVSAGVILGLAGVSTLIARGLADVPPTLHGNELMLEVEVRLPKGAPQPVATTTPSRFLSLGTASGPAAAPRKSKQGELHVADAKLTEGRWVIPGDVELFTARGTHVLTIVMDDRHAIGFVLPLAAHPGDKDKEWSPWQPSSMGGKPWPDTKISYRYSVSELVPTTETTPTTADLLAALGADAPLANWLAYLDYNDTASAQTIMKTVEARQADLAKSLRSANWEESDHAMHAAQLLTSVDPAVVQALRDVAADAESKIRKFTALAPDNSDLAEVGNDARNLVKAWSLAWGAVCEKSGIDGRAPLQEIVRLASLRNSDGFMQEIIGDAQTQLCRLKAC
ncbi:MAG TPA: hypothetical protein VHW09_28890 [Bryobacteraceae bacterium]|jgi:hypothetical protein|nr:hypothetical protein [Bryobacteraceae bacterium]